VAAAVAVAVGWCYTLVGGCRTIAASLTFIASGEPPVMVWGRLEGEVLYIASAGMAPPPPNPWFSRRGVFLPAALSTSLFSLGRT